MIVAGDDIRRLDDLRPDPVPRDKGGFDALRLTGHIVTRLFLNAHAAALAHPAGQNRQVGGGLSFRLAKLRPSRPIADHR